MNNFLVIFLFLTMVNFFTSNVFAVSLDEYLTNHGVTAEQNAGHMNIFPEYDAKAIYYKDMLMENSNIRTIAEIGFALGHSSDVYLNTRDDVEMVSFDIMYHWFNWIGKNYIDIKYPNRHILLSGDSLKTVPFFVKKNPGKTFDLVIVDGGNEYLWALQDIINMRSLSCPDTILIVDDIELEPVAKAYQECIENGLVEEIERRSGSGCGWVLGRYVQ